MPSNPLLLEYVKVLLGPTNATHNLSLPPLPSVSLFSFCCIPALMELQQEDKVVSKSFSAFLGTVSDHKHCSWNAMICLYTHTAANNDKKKYKNEVTVSLSRYAEINTEKHDLIFFSFLNAVIKRGIFFLKLKVLCFMDSARTYSSYRKKRISDSEACKQRPKVACHH